MRHFAPSLACLPLLLSAAPALAQAAAKGPTVPANPISYKDEAAVVEHIDTTIRMHPDGTGDRVDHLTVRVQSEGAVRQLGVLSVPFAAASAKGSIEHVRVRKPDGTVIETPSTDSLELTAPITREAPLYSDLKEVQLPVRSLAAGDVLDYDLHTVYTRAEAPDQFWGAERLHSIGVQLEHTFTLQLPAAKYVQVWSPNYKPVITDRDGIRTYRWTTSQLKPTPAANADAPDNDTDSDKPEDKDLDEDAQGRKLPSLAWTTFHSWAEVGDWYRKLALSRSDPDAATRARADDLTKNAKTPEDQLRALYTFVAAKTRYVGIDLGVGRFQPHSAADVLSNQYGDCKDKDTLLEALLRAKGFTTAPALIGAGLTPVPDVPSPAVFNHVITTVQLPGNGERLWLDSTAEVGPFRWLSPPLRDQEALVIPANSPATLQKTPAAPPYPLSARFEAEATLTDEGTLKGKIKGIYRNDDEIVIRALARNVAPAEWDKASQYLSALSGFSGTTSETRFTATSDFANPAALSYNYTNKSYGDWENLRIVPLFPAIGYIDNSKEKKPPLHDIDLGGPRTDVSTSRIHLPKGWHTDLPDAIHAKSPYATLDKTYRFDGDSILVERTYTVLKQKVPKADYKQYQAFIKDAGFSGENWIQLLRPTKTDTVAKASQPDKLQQDAHGLSQATTPFGSSKNVEPAAPDADMLTLKQTAVRQLGNHEVGAARQTIDRIKAKNPSETNLFALYGAVAEVNGQFDEAIVDYRKELAAHPDQTGAVRAIANVQRRQGNLAEARESLQPYVTAHPQDTQAAQQLAHIQSQMQDYTGAVATLQIISAANPEDRPLRLQLSNALFAAGRLEEASAAAKSVLDGTDDPYMLNDAGYVLAETGQDLPQAEAASRKSIARLEEKSRAITPQEVNSSAFASSNLLIASWDTLGWILFREGKFAEAKPYLTAAWRDDLHAEVGDHLAQLDEALGQPGAALKQYRLAHASIEGQTIAPALRRHIDESITRLTPSGTAPQKPAVSDASMEASIKKQADLTPDQKQKMLDALRNRGSLSSMDVQALQESRTYHLPRKPDTSGWGTFRLQITADGNVHAAGQASGESKLQPMAAAVQALHFPDLVPTGSTAYLLRSGVLSCSSGTTCDLVLVPNGTLQTEQQQ